MTELRDFTFHMIGHGHIDPTWLWRWTEGYEEVRATFRSALDRMKETPQFGFTSSSACFYAWIKEVDPEMFEEIRERVREGRWEVVGGWWVEPDCNVPGGESFVRHGLYAQRFFERELGVRARVGFNPDSFGHAGTLPQILSKMGIQYYVYMRPEPFWEREYPGGATFWWQANDGSRILAYCLLGSYNGNDRETAQKMKDLPHNPNLNPGQTQLMAFFGVGNHGGGPTKRTIEALLEAQKDPEQAKIEFSTIQRYFDSLVSTTAPENIPAIDTDLQHHARGCYSVHSEVKRLIRRAEHALMTAERFETVLWLLEGKAYSNALFEQAWRDVLYNQFHDILAGTSIRSSYDDTRDQMGRALFTAKATLNHAIQRIARHVDTSAEGNTIMVVNPLPWPVKQVVVASPIAGRELHPTFHLMDNRTTDIHIVDDKNAVVPVQTVLGEQVAHRGYAFTAEVPALGYRCYHARAGIETGALHGMLEGGRDYLENDWWRIEFEPSRGHISRLFDKKSGVEVLKKGNILAAMVDQSDTWGHGYKDWAVEAGRFGQASLELLECGAVQATVRIVSHYNKSTADQFVTIYRDTADIDCLFRINWQERYTMLKLAYETNVADGAAMYDAPYGCQSRGTDGSEEPGQQWFDLSGKVGEKPYGLAVLNDSKYGFDIGGNVMRVTLLRSPVYAHHYPNRMTADEPYPVMDQGEHEVCIRLLPHAKAWDTTTVPRAAWELNEPMIVHVESGHSGDLPGWASFLSCSADNVLLSVLKKCEDGDDLIVRGYETAGRAAEAIISVPHLGKSITASFAPHEIKTLRLGLGDWKAREVNLLEE